EEFGAQSAFFPVAIDALTTYFQDHRVEMGGIYQKWTEKFAEVYRKGDVSEALYMRHAYLSLLIKLVLCTFYFPEEPEFSLPAFSRVNALLAQRQADLFEPDFFSWVMEVPEVCGTLFGALQGHSFEAGDLFCRLYEELVSPATRQGLGEFYTPPALAQLMVTDGYQFGDRVLDPACGSGTFLLEIARVIMSANQDLDRKCAALGNLFGFDINPIAVLTAKANLLLALDRFIAAEEPTAASQVVPIHIFLCNFLLPLEDQDVPVGARAIQDAPATLIIGNPPWIPINSIYSAPYKQAIVALGKQYNIYIGGKKATSTEIATLFVYQGIEFFLRDGGRVAFVAPASLLAGGQHEKFRWFRGLRDVRFWDFDRDIFPQCHVCFFATAGKQEDEARIHPHVTHFHVDVDPLAFTPLGEELYEPAYVKNNGTGVQVGKLNPVRGKESENSLGGSLFPFAPSPYHDRFFQGASLVPRNLVFVKIQSVDGGLVIITPDPSVKAQYDKGWDFLPYESAQVWAADVRKVIKSTELLPFHALGTCLNFLPLRAVEDDVDGVGPYYDFPDPAEMEEHSRQHYLHLEELYQQHRQAAGAVPTLREELTYLNKLCNRVQRAPLRVIHNASGTIPKAAILRDDTIIVDSTLYQCACRSDDEAYYLLGIINSPVLRDNISRICPTGAKGSVRHLNLSLWDFPFPEYEGTAIQRNIAASARQCETLVVQLVNVWVDREFCRVRGKNYCLSCGSVVPVNKLDSHLCGRSAFHYQNRSYLQPKYEFVELYNQVRMKPKTIQNLIMGYPDFRHLVNTLAKIVCQLVSGN
ncbi:MAG TPA: N-6 DNA methylase, partial [Candidatus Lokiarchaeia archaeon]|nr:N-6 DNA methylase [Candidatus Lokiarchaeia archaeon]